MIRAALACIVAAALTGCAALQSAIEAAQPPAADGVVIYVREYCALPRDERPEVQTAMREAIAPHRITVTCGS